MDASPANDPDNLINHVLVRRLLAFYDPFAALDFKWAPSEAIQAEWIPDEYRIDEYHQARVQYFIQRLRNGDDLEPITIDNVCERNHIYAIPFLVDGHHRFIAYVVERRRTIPISYSGRIDLLRYLEGRARRRPQD